MLKIYNVEEFINRIRDVDEIVLFGAGRNLREAEKFFVGTEVAAKISKVMDNDVKKQGNEVTLWGRRFEIQGKDCHTYGGGVSKLNSSYYA